MSPKDNEDKNPTDTLPEPQQTARDVTKDAFPYITGDEGPRSSGNSLHGIVFLGELCHWANFQKEVRTVFNEIKWDKEPVLDRLKPNDLYHSEHFRCGAEISTSGRYIAHVLNPMSGIATKLGFQLRFGDWHAVKDHLKWMLPDSSDDESADDVTRDDETMGQDDNTGDAEGEDQDRKKPKRSIPDYAIIDESHEARALGEAKHPWRSFPGRWIQGAIQGDAQTETRLRRFVGQIARDMWAADLKYAFMTNYRETVFLRREKVQGKWTLFYSDAIRFDATSDMDNFTVSVRECMLYLFKITSQVPKKGGWSLGGMEKEPLEAWVRIPKRSKKKKTTDNTSASNKSTDNKHTGNKSTYADQMTVVRRPKPPAGSAAGPKKTSK
ncbi:uncharacterized protein BO80DRAFT_432935 [Aspergillus ibericus CBS 121593]|uniref:Uncharacterized protein n=1 Tax=Aspergillus ibericus CBS 121593 TaxID=1448316 RepID=A0A395H6B1_9EURO|nr:hypothetical protein BO80DRAFT_432935 [Aspergillus ibericus CBS 121593]RAL03146.1 hypothetical protein BO80DRAFT_432935 [Aspergillus ibericus CBS 121593]